MDARLLEIVVEYASQGAHRTGTQEDDASASWLMRRMTLAGVPRLPQVESFDLRRRDVLAAALIVFAPEGPWTVTGVPLYDCASYTDVEGVTGVFGMVGEQCDIALFEYSSNAQLSEGFEEGRVGPQRHVAMVAAYAPQPGGLGGLPLCNAPRFGAGGVGCPVLQVSSCNLQRLRDAASQGSKVRLVASMRELGAQAANVSAVVPGSDASLPPVVVMTPRSGWWACAVERASGLAALLEILRSVSDSKPQRTVLFFANTGHELGHAGMEALCEQRPHVFRNAHLCFHIGANWASADVAPSSPVAVLQTSSRALEQTALEAFKKQDLDHEKFIRIPEGVRPFGEAQQLSKLGAKYVSMLGTGNRRFHMASDSEPAVDLNLLVRMTSAFIDLVLSASGAQPAAAKL